MEISEFVGQDEIKRDICIHLGHSILKNVPFEHAILWGVPGIGKTTLAYSIAQEMGTKIHQKMGGELDKEELFSVLESINYMDILFVEDIERVPSNAIAKLSGSLEIINELKRNEESRSAFSFEGRTIEPFTLIGATSDIKFVELSIRNRFMLNYNLLPYNDIEISEILKRKNCPSTVAQIISKRSRGVPQLALNYFLRLRNEYMEAEKITNKACLDFFGRLNVDESGFSKTDLEILSFIQENDFVTHRTIWKSLRLSESEFEQMYKPFILTRGLIKITKRGIILTKSGIDFLKIKTP